MGVLPLQYINGESAESLGLDGTETYSITGVSSGLEPLKKLIVVAEIADNSSVKFEVICRLDSDIEIEYYKNGGILHYVLRQFLKK